MKPRVRQMPKTGDATTYRVAVATPRGEWRETVHVASRYPQGVAHANEAWLSISRLIKQIEWWSGN